MTKKDYELIAGVVEIHAELSNSQPREVGDAVEHLARDLATALKFHNPRFDAQVFLKACGV